MGKIAVVITVLNEQDSISDLITALRAQTKPPAEVAIVDGGSADQTWHILKKSASRWPRLKAFQHSGNRSIGRNFAVSKTSAPIIAFTDAGCVPDPDWLEELIKPFSDPAVTVVSGYYRADAGNVFEKCLTPYVLVMPDKAAKGEFFPSTRSMALRRSVWKTSGGFDPRLFYNEDYAFAHSLKNQGNSFTFAPGAVVAWTPRPDMKSAALMFLRFAFGDAYAGILRPKVKMLAIRYFLYVFGFFLLWEVQKSWLAGYILFPALVYGLWAITKNYHYVRRPEALFWLPVLQITADITVILGTLMGLMSRSYELP